MAGPDVGDRRDRPHDVDRPRVELLASSELAEDVRLDQRGVVDEDLGHAEPVDRLVERRAQPRLVGHVDA